MCLIAKNNLKIRHGRVERTSRFIRTSCVQMADSSIQFSCYLDFEIRGFGVEKAVKIYNFTFVFIYGS